MDNGTDWVEHMDLVLGNVEVDTNTDKWLAPTLLQQMEGDIVKGEG